MNSNKYLSEYFINSYKRLIELSKHLDIVKHGGIKGTIREALINEFLLKCLPPIVNFISGEIVDPLGNRSGQIDIILQSNSDPRIPLYQDFHIALCDCVLAVIEVKSKLTTGKATGNNSFVQGLNSIKKVKKLERWRPIEHTSPLAEKKCKIPCILFAYKGPSCEVLRKAIKEYTNYYKYSKELIDLYFPEMIIVLDKGYFIYKDDGWIYKKIENNIDKKLIPKDMDNKVLTGIFVLLCNIIQSWDQRKWNSNYIDYL